MNNPVKALKPFDYFAIFTALLALTAVFLPAFTGANGERTIQVSSPEGEWLYPVTAQLEFRPVGLPGSCLVSIKDQSVRVLESNCLKNICIQVGEAKKPGDWIACLPHKVFIRVIGTPAETEPQEIDALST